MAISLGNLWVKQTAILLFNISESSNISPDPPDGLALFTHVPSIPTQILEPLTANINSCGKALVHLGPKSPKLTPS